MENLPAGFELLSSTVGFDGKIFKVMIDQLRLPTGQQMRFDFVDHPGAVTLVPVDDRRRVWFVRQYRHAVKTELLELPAGTLEPGEPVEVTALRECREEIGMAADKLERLGELLLVPGYSSERTHVYLATELRPSPLARDEDELLEVVQVELDRVQQMMHDGTLRDAKTLASLTLALPRLNGGQG